MIRSEDDHEPVTTLERQVTEAHPDLIGKLSREDILAMAKEGVTHTQRGAARRAR